MSDELHQIGTLLDTFGQGCELCEAEEFRTVGFEFLDSVGDLRLMTLCREHAIEWLDDVVFARALVALYDWTTGECFEP